MKRSACAALLSLLAAVPLASADGFADQYLTDPDDGMPDASRFLSEIPLGFLPVPSLITEPAVGVGMALGVLFFHESAEQRQMRTSEQRALVPENISVLGGAYTENGTWAGGVGHLGFWRRDTLRYRGFLGYVSPNLDFYSLPAVGDLPRPIELNLEGPILFQELKYRIPDTHVFVGGRQLYRKVEVNLAGSPDLSILPPAFTDYIRNNFDNEIATSGLGVVVEYDSRDNPFNPQKGYNYVANYTIFDDAIGSDADYASYLLSGLNYWQPGERWNLGLRLSYEGVEAKGKGSLPPYVPPFIDMRGIPKSRYQGESVALGEVQLDYKIGMRWKVGVFGGLGRAADSFDDLGDAKSIDSLGAGFRYLVAKRYGFMMGVDVARGPEETAVYIQAGSTW